MGLSDDLAGIAGKFRMCRAGRGLMQKRFRSDHETAGMPSV
jgi:hypothetical protein